MDKLPRKKQVVLVGSQVGDLAGVATNGLPVTSVIKAGEKPRNKYKETAEAVGAWPGPALELAALRRVVVARERWRNGAATLLPPLHG